MFQEHLDVLACPDCRGSLGVVPAPEGDPGLSCGACQIAFPSSDGIPILLPRSARSCEVELPLVEALRAAPQTETVCRALDDTTRLLKGFEGRRSWEWEDEEYWREKYRRQTERFLAGEQMDEKRWAVRFWQREFLIENLPNALWGAGKTIVDIGCGAGHNFRILLSPHCDPSTLYLAADISLDGLKFNRLRNPHENALYVLCSADSLPFRDGSVDMLCYFGILHHTERQAGTIEEDSRLLKPGGVAILHEAITRKSPRPGFLPVENPGSEHEETIDREELLDGIRRAPGLDVLAQKWSHTVVMGLGKKVLRRWLRGRGAYSFVAAIDRASLGLGRVSPWFEPGEVLMVLSKEGEAPATS